jgi:cell division protein ZapE
MLNRIREPSSSSLRARYEARINANELKPDPAQAEAVSVLAALESRLKGYRPAAAHNPLARFITETSTPPRGLYLYGGVGRGKSMLMDLFFAAAPVTKKRRVHFHQFMLEVHARLHRLQTGQVENILPRLAHDLAKEAWLLCFDEFHVGNIADAMILGRLFENLFDQGVVIVATSNWPPDDLYKNGLQRDRFAPFIGLLKKRMDIHHMEGVLDHRQEKLRGTPSYFSPLGGEATTRLQKIFTQLTDGEAAEATHLPVEGRAVAVPRAAKGVAFFTFAELCGEARGAADYLALASCFHAILIDQVPRLDPERRDEIARFTTLIDTLYEVKVKLYMAAAAPPDKLCAGGDQSFAFQRTASRLAEMQGEEYRRAAHLA